MVWILKGLTELDLLLCYIRNMFAFLIPGYCSVTSAGCVTLSVKSVEVDLLCHISIWWIRWQCFYEITLCVCFHFAGPTEVMATLRSPKVLERYRWGVGLGALPWEHICQLPLGQSSSASATRRKFNLLICSRSCLSEHSWAGVHDKIGWFCEEEIFLTNLLEFFK